MILFECYLTEKFADIGKPGKVFHENMVLCIATKLWNNNNNSFLQSSNLLSQTQCFSKKTTWRQPGSIRHPNIGTILYSFKCVRVITRKTCAPKWCPQQNVSLTKTSSAANSHYISNQTTESWSFNEKVYAKQAARSNSQNNFQSGLQRKPNNLHLLADPIRDSLREQLKKMWGILCAISSEELITLGMHPSRGYSSLVLIDQLSQLTQCEWNFLLRDTTCSYSRG